MMKPKQWNERFALINRYSPSDEQITRTFSISQSELNSARDLYRAGAIAASSTYDVEAGNPFTTESSDTVTTTRKATKPSTVKTISKPETSLLPPETATRPSVKKRGRKGEKIANAFRSIPASPVSLDEFAKRWNISIPVLRQSKRFDAAPELGRVIVKINKESGVLQIWRESNKQ